MVLLRSTDALVDWMQDVYLSELVLLAASKRRIVVGMRDLDYAGARDRFRVWALTPQPPVTWVVDGELDDDAELTFARVAGCDAPVAIALNAGGRAVLTCAAIAADEQPPKLRKARPRPWQHDFTMEHADARATVGELLAHLGLPTLASFGEPRVVAAPGWSLASLRDRSHRAFCAMAGAREVVAITPIFRGEPGWTLGVQRRRGATDDEWDRAWRLPGVLGAGPVRSRTFVGDAAAWTTLDWRRGVAGTIA